MNIKIKYEYIIFMYFIYFVFLKMSRDVFDLDLPPLVFSVTFRDKTRATYPPFERHVTLEWPLRAKKSCFQLLPVLPFSKLYHTYMSTHMSYNTMV